MQKTNQRESVKVLEEAIQLQLKKSQDYQNPKSRVRQVDHYPRGVYTILDTVNGKLMRMYSVLETMEHGGTVNFESVEDSAVDAINYLSFIVAYMRGEIDGQQGDKDIFNRRVSENTSNEILPKKFQKQPSTVICNSSSGFTSVNLSTLLQNQIPIAQVDYSKPNVRTYINGKFVEPNTSATILDR